MVATVVSVGASDQGFEYLGDKFRNLRVILEEVEEVFGWRGVTRGRLGWRGGPGGFRIKSADYRQSLVLVKHL